MSTFSHYIVTRFNVKSNNWVKDKNGNIVNDLNWLKHRYYLFETFCLPSILSQTNKNFKWLVFFDKNTPSEYVNKNLKFKRSLPQFTPCYVNDYLDFENTLRELVYSKSKSEYVMTTRFDNDDCFHEEAIQEIHNSFVKKDLTVIEFSRGLTLLLGNANKLAKRENLYYGPFLTLIEYKSENKYLKTIYDREHTLWANLGHYISIDKDYYWLQTIHDANISNKLNVDLTFKKSLLKRFNFNYDVQFKLSYILFVICKNIGFFKLKNSFKIK